ncbi:hypothetical protein M427DRAFT_174253 [Gonapodya prolifera JEL478]|uniref:Cyclin-like domain-containing protein n=1 Tax=Gonapodya prolifera (strain JEL478) TaxID=1344416 RepID=A0A139B0I6_GONPJ|nr:hypothetical protein M427DRAFT_174253 [Gonapodya prolifera JEL478]|eukprot:KXS22508.1 hypothetical protein M427DRAFT_174253 [Gonapodya prolifera JEL478]
MAVLREEEVLLPPLPCYMNYQADLSWSMRRTLVEWLSEVHSEFDLRPETLFLSIGIMDRYLSRRVVPCLEFQLVGVTSLWLASKYEEIHGRVPCLQQLSYVCCNAYRVDDFVQMELRLLQELNYNLSIPSPEAFLKLQCGLLFRDAQTHAAVGGTAHNQACGCNDVTMPSAPSSRGTLPARLQDHIPCILAAARYLCELTLVHKRFVGCRPSMIATAAFVLAEKILGCGIIRVSLPCVPRGSL